MTATRPDLMYSVSLLSRFMSSPTHVHLLAAKRILRYIQGTVQMGILYKRGGRQQLIGYTDSDYAGDVEDRKSTSGYVFLVSDGAVTWTSKKKPIVTLSTTEAEFVAAGAAACQVVWMMKIIKELGLSEEDNTEIYCDNSSAIRLSQNPILHGKSKHIEVRFHYLRELVRTGSIKLRHCGTINQIADIFTKPLSKENFLRLRGMLGMCETPNVN